MFSCLFSSWVQTKVAILPNMYLPQVVAAFPGQFYTGPVCIWKSKPIYGVYPILFCLCTIVFREKEWKWDGER